MKDTLMTGLHNFFGWPVPTRHGAIPVLRSPEPRNPVSLHEESDSLLCECVEKSVSYRNNTIPSYSSSIKLAAADWL